MIAWYEMRVYISRADYGWRGADLQFAAILTGLGSYKLHNARATVGASRRVDGWTNRRHFSDTCNNVELAFAGVASAWAGFSMHALRNFNAGD